MRYLYNLLFYLILPFILLRLLWRSYQSPGYRHRIAERFGFINFSTTVKPVWVHAVSFGEAKLATILVENLLKLHPEIPFVVTTMTVTGSEQIRKNLGPQVFHSYIPYDYPAAIKRFLNKLNPRLVIIMETELWPNVLHYCGQQNIPVLIANARLAERSIRGYQRINFFIRPMLQHITKVLAQSTADAERFVKLGIDKNKVSVVGNIKFDITPPKNSVTKNRLTWIAASTHHGEDEIILKAFAKIREQLPEVLLILVPRHPERFDEVALLCQRSAFKISRRSENKNITANIDIFLGDTMGELWKFYATADVAFVGGSLIPQGGHNLLEPAALGLPIITGSYLANFKQVAELLQQADALNIVDNAQQLADEVIKLLQNPELRQQQGQQAKTVVETNRGALEKHLQIIKSQILL